MEPFSLVILFGAMVALVIWSLVDNRAHDREGRRAAKRADLAEAARLTSEAKRLRQSDPRRSR